MITNNLKTGCKSIVGNFPALIPYRNSHFNRPHVKHTRNNYRRQVIRMQYFDRLQLKTIAESDLLPKKMKETASRDLSLMSTQSEPNLPTDSCVLTGYKMGCVKDYKINRMIFRDEGHLGRVAGLKFWRYPNYSRWDKEKLLLRLSKLYVYDPYYKQMADELAKNDNECKEILNRLLYSDKSSIRNPATDLLWRMRRNYTPDKHNMDYYF